MNIFFIEENPEAAAQSLCDVHVNKLISESCQMLCAAFWELPSPVLREIIPWKSAYINHISTVWVRQSPKNFEWLLAHLKELIHQYDLRFQKPECHTKARQTLLFCEENYHQLSFPVKFGTLAPLAFGTDSNEDLNQIYQSLKPKYAVFQSCFGVNGAYIPTSKLNLIEAYREYYCYKIFKNGVLPSWKKLSNSPSWYKHLPV